MSTDLSRRLFLKFIGSAAAVVATTRPAEMILPAVREPAVIRGNSPGGVRLSAWFGDQWRDLGEVLDVDISFDAIDVTSVDDLPWRRFLPRESSEIALVIKQDQRDNLRNLFNSMKQARLRVEFEGAECVHPNATMVQIKEGTEGTSVKFSCSSQPWMMEDKS